MPVDRQFRQRLTAWQKELKEHILIPVEEVAFEGCPTMERLTHEQAAALPFAPMPVGTAWGHYREYCWFRGEVTIPASCAGQRVVWTSGLDGEQLVYVDGVARGSIDKEHKEVTLFREAPAGARVSLLVESYAGHGARLENGGPCPPERRPIPETPELQCVIRPSGIAIFNEDAFALSMDVDTLVGLWNLLPDAGVRWQQVDSALRAFTHTADFEQPYEQRNASFRAARECLREALSAHNGTSAPVLDIIGNSHIDLAWLWPLEETFHKVVRTYANQLALMEEYPEYRFLACEPILLEMLKQTDPEVFDRLVQAVKRGQMQPEGAFYVECDTNIPSGESLIRQLYWGKKWFRDTFGIESRVAWQPDTFGFSAVLPQLLKGFDIPYFSTQKLLRCDPECQRFPYQDFLWEGADGTRVQANSYFNSNSKTEPKDLHDRWELHRSQRTGISRITFPFGYGDGGGGSTRQTLEFLRREVDLEGLPRTEWHSVAEHFELTAKEAARNVWNGELYLAWHRGTYTSQRKTKLGIRRLEQSLHDLEMILCSCSPEVRQRLRPQVREAWEVLMLHQFHDICAGCGLRDVHREAEEALNAAADRVEALTRQLIDEVYEIEPDRGEWTMVNTLGFTRVTWVTLPDGREGPVLLPPFSATYFDKFEDIAIEDYVVAKEKEDGWDLSAGLICHVDRQGRVTRLVTAGLDWQDEGMVMNELRVYKDVEPIYDAWELSRDYVLDRTDEVKVTGCEVERNDSLCFILRVDGMVGSSPCTQRIILRAGESMLRFTFDIDWRERHRLLKVHFGSNIRTRNAICDMQMCQVERPTHRSGPYEQDRYEVVNRYYTALFEPGRGIALFNRGIWGISCNGGDLDLSLLHAPTVPDDTCDRGPQHFEYALGVYDKPFAFTSVTRDGYDYNVPVLLRPGLCDEYLGPVVSNAIIETMKPAEEGDGIVLRLWEHRGTRSEASLELPHEYRVYDCGMQEKDRVLLGQGLVFWMELKPYEIRTLLLERVYS